jgi:eukaryotic translation initiation factor 2C
LGYRNNLPPSGYRANAPPSHYRNNAPPSNYRSNPPSNYRNNPPSNYRANASIPPRPAGTHDQQYSNIAKDSGMYYPPPKALTKQDETPANNGKDWSLPQDMTDRTSILTNKEPQFPLRQDFFPIQKSPKILTNHFEYGVESGTIFYEYKILGLVMKDRRKLKALMKNVIQNSDFLSSNESSFATNYIDTIVAWKSLHATLDAGLHDPGDNSTEWHRSITVGDHQIPFRFRFVKKIPVHDLEQYAHGDPSYESVNFDDIARCLNLVISKSFSPEVHKLSANKFFVKKARVLLDVSNCLELIRGYFYSVKPGMGNIILNFNIATSAVFRPITVDDFLNGNNTFDKSTVAHILRGKSVYLDRERQDSDPKKEAHLNSEDARYFNICEIQREGNIEDLCFKKKKVENGKLKKIDGGFEMEDEVTYVIDHLEAGKHVS